MPAPAAPTGFAEMNGAGTLNSTTSVELVAAPGASATRVIKVITIWNADTASVTVRLRLTISGTHRVFAQRTLAPGQDFLFDGPVVLDATTDSITAVLTAAVAATQPDYTVHFAEIT
jgi:hypothetical protein